MNPLELVQPTIGLNEEALEEWIGHREDIKKPLTPRSRKMVIKKLLGWSESEQMRIVEACVENGWRGLHWVEPPKKASSRSTDIMTDITDRSWARPQGE